MGANDEGSDGTTVDTGEIDPAQLESQLSEIKGAMGLEERYPGQRRLWLVYGGVVAVASLLAQLVFVWSPDVSGTAYLSIWIAYALVTGLSMMRLAAGMPRTDENAPLPDWRVLFGTLVLAYVAAVLQGAPVLAGADHALVGRAFARLEGAYAYSLIVLISGIGFLFAGNTLRTYRIRRRDRWVFYGAGVWMLAYAVVFTTYSSIMGAIGYGLFGGCFLCYSLAAYVLLGRSDGS